MVDNNSEQLPSNINNVEQDNNEWKTISTKHRSGAAVRLTKSQPSTRTSTPKSSIDKSNCSWSELVQSHSPSSKQSQVLQRPTSAIPPSSFLLSNEHINEKPISSRPLAQSFEKVHLQLNSLNKNINLKPVGLINYGNRCYLNATLQLLLNCAPFLNVIWPLIDRFPSLTSGTILNPFGRFVERYVSCERPSLLPTELIDYFLWKRTFDDNREQDVQEFLTFILDEIHRCMLQEKEILNWSFNNELCDTEEEGGEWMEVDKKGGVVGSRTMGLEPSPISALFFGRTRSLIERVKGKNSSTIEPFHCLSLEIIDPSITSLESALSHMAKSETIEDSNIRKSLKLEHLPPILLIHFKRFVYNHEMGVRKLNSFISYPAEFTPSTHILHGRAIHERAEYYLASVIYHHGRSTECGHYTVHLRHHSTDTTSWYFVDDDHITKNISTGQVLQDKGSSQTAYMLMYIKKNLS